MARNFLGISLLGYASALAICIPFILGLMFIFSKEIRKAKIVNKIFYCCLMSIVNLITLFLCFFAVFRNFGLIGFLKDVAKSRCYYNDIWFIPLYIAVSVMVALGFGMIFWMICLGKSKSLYINVAHIGITIFAVIELSALAVCYFSGIKKLQINEICASNAKSYLVSLDDVLFENCDYIELKNTGCLRIKLDNYYLSDKEKNLKKYNIAGNEIAPGEYIVIALDKDFDKEGMFGLSKKGETVYLSYDSFLGFSILETVEYPELKVNVTWSRISDASDWNYMNCTPEAPNGDEISIIAEPIFSADSGFYDDAFYLSVTVPDGYHMVYTTDGSTPTMESTEYTEPIYVYDRSREANVYRSIKNVVIDYDSYTPSEKPVDKAFLIRGFIYNDESQGQEFVKTYFVGLDSAKYDKVVSLVVDPEDMWGESGIYVTGVDYDFWYTHGKEGDAPLANFQVTSSDYSSINYEIPANMSYYEGENILLNQNIGLRIQGASTREYPLKRFNLFARKIYSGSSVFDLKFFSEKDSHSLNLRFEYGGGDVNALLNNLVLNRHADARQSVKVSTFVNGEFWYDTYMCERFDERFYSEKYGIDKDLVGILDSFSEFVNWYDKWDVVDNIWDIDLFDVQSFIDFYIINMYYSNFDINEGHNVACWIKADADENVGPRIGWSLYDIDCLDWASEPAFGKDRLVEVNPFNGYNYNYFNYNTAGFYNKMLEVDGFKEQFAITFMDLVNTNFAPENVEKEMEMLGIDDDVWLTRYFTDRPKYMTGYVAEEFGLSGQTETITLSVNDANGGKIKVNTCYPSFDNGKWQGTYFTDIPITLSVEPLEGYEFAGWSGSVTSNETIITVPMNEGAKNIEATFIKK